jgi:hypothetical protein
MRGNIGLENEIKHSIHSAWRLRKQRKIYVREKKSHRCFCCSIFEISKAKLNKNRNSFSLVLVNFLRIQTEASRNSKIEPWLRRKYRNGAEIASFVDLQLHLIVLVILRSQWGEMGPQFDWLKPGLAVKREIDFLIQMNNRERQRSVMSGEIFEMWIDKVYMLGMAGKRLASLSLYY